MRFCDWLRYDFAFRYVRVAIFGSVNDGPIRARWANVSHDERIRITTQRRNRVIEPVVSPAEPESPIFMIRDISKRRSASGCRPARCMKSTCFFVMCRLYASDARHTTPSLAHVGMGVAGAWACTAVSRRGRARVRCGCAPVCGRLTRQPVFRVS